jgi:preprotein translocase subunit YajC
MEFLVIGALFLAVMWFMSSRTRKQQQEALRFRDNLQAGQEVMTIGRMYGTVVEVDGDRVTLELLDGVTGQWDKSAIAKLVEPPLDELDDGEYDDEVDEDVEYDEEYDEEYTGDDLDAEDGADDLVEDETEGDVVVDEGAEEWEDVDVPDDASSLSPDEDDEKPR